jgi:hypothetical protein
MFTVAFLCQRDAAELDVRLSPRFFRRHSGAQIVFDVKGQMAFQLFGEFLLAALAMGQAEEPHQEVA